MNSRRRQGYRAAASASDADAVVARLSALDRFLPVWIGGWPYATTEPAARQARPERDEPA